MNPPAGPRQRPADVHRRSVAGQETREDECRWPVLRAARAHRAKSGKEARKVPGEFAKAVPPRRSEVVRVNRAGSPGDRGSCPLHDLKMMPFRCRNKNGVKLAVSFQEFADLNDSLLGGTARHAERHVRAIHLDFGIALVVQPPRSARRDQPVTA